VLGQIQAVVKPLLRPHLLDMEQKLAPGMFTLTWTSLNIDGYLHRWGRRGWGRLGWRVRLRRPVAAAGCWRSASHLT
jgi:dynein heavy chain